MVWGGDLTLLFGCVIPTVTTKIIWCGPFFKVFVAFITTLLLLYVLFFFDSKACGILAPQPGIEPALPALEGEVLTAGPLKKSPFPAYW